jgi:hypothetical protein
LSATQTQRVLTIDGPHTTEVLKVLNKGLGKAGIATALLKAARIIDLAVNPLAGLHRSHRTDCCMGSFKAAKPAF